MITLKLTSKRQATFPLELCSDLGLQQGDEIILDKTIGRDGEPTWTLRRVANNLDWFGALREYSHVSNDDPDAYEDAIAEGIADEFLENDQ